MDHTELIGDDASGGPDRICPQCQRETSELVCPHDGFKTLDSARFKAVAVDPLIGQTFEGRYTIETLLGRGGFGSVYRGTQIGIGRKVAVKVLSPDLGASLSEIARFQQEARALAALKHPNIVDVYDFGQTAEGELYIVMEYLDGQSLGQLVEGRRALAPEDTIAIGLQILDALGEAHSQGIVHRDLKPANLLLTTGARGRVVLKVLDFGIARVSGDAASSMKLTKTGMVIGSPPYMSPEQCSGKPITAQSDIYSVGCILYECLTGRQLFDLPTPTAYLVAHVTEPPDPPMLGSQRLHGPLVDAILAMLAKRPADRPAGADAAHALLEEALAAGPISGLEPSDPDDTLSMPREKLFASPVRTGKDLARIGTGQTKKPATAETRKPATGPRGSVPTGLSRGDTQATEAPRPRSRAPLFIAVALLMGGGAAAAVVLAGGTGPAVAEADKTPTATPTPSPSPAPPRASTSTSTPPKTAEAPKPAAPDPKPAAPDPKPEVPKPVAEVPKPPEPAPPATTAPPAPVVEAPKPYVVQLTSKPAATVMRDGKNVGTTPYELTWERDAAAPQVTLVAKGYLDLKVVLDATKDGAAQEVTLKRRPVATTTPGATGPTW